MSTNVFGEDLSSEVLRRFMRTRPGGDNSWGFAWIDITKKQLLEETCIEEDWKPFTFSEDEFILLHIILKHGNSILASELTDDDEEALELLAAKNLIEVGNEVRLLTHRLQLAVDPDLGFIGGEDGAGRFTRWVIKKAQNSTVQGSTVESPQL